MKKNRNNIKTFSDLYEKSLSSNDLVSTFILGHLMIEFLLIKIVEIGNDKLVDLAEELNHFRLINLVYGLGHIPESQKEVLQEINAMRNKFAHDITFIPTILEVQNIFLKAKNAFEDLTDGIEQGLGELKGKTDIAECEDWLFAELFMQISYDLQATYMYLGGHYENF